MKVLSAVTPMFPDPDDAEQWNRWQCPGCGEDMQQPKSVPPAFQRVGGLCYGCEQRARLTQTVALVRATVLEQAGCPPKYLESFVEPQTWPVDPARRDLGLSSWDGAPWSVVFTGPVRSGKTMLATELLWRVLSKRKGRGLWVRAGEFINRCFGNLGDEAKAEAWRLAYEAPAVLFDDLGRGHDGRAWNVMVEVASHRFDNDLPTIWTTNRQLVSDGGERERGLAQEDAALYRRLADGLFVPMKAEW